MIVYLVMEEVRKLNLLPVKNGISKYFSPWTIIKGIAIDYEQCTTSYLKMKIPEDLSFRPIVNNKNTITSNLNTFFK